MKKAIFSISIILILFPASLKSQEVNDSSIIFKNTVFRVNLLPPGISVEKYLAGNATMLFDIGAGISYTWYDNFFEPDIAFVPYLALEPRLYTNLQTRKQRGKSVDYYSGAYGAFRIQGGFIIEPEDWYLQFCPMIGYQETFEYGIYFSIAAGPGATIIIDENTRFGLVGYLKFGYMIK